MKKLILFTLFLLSFTHMHAMNNEILQGVSFFSPRSQSVDAVRYQVGWHPYIHRYDHDSWYITTQITPEFKTSFRSNRIAQALFGTNTLFVSGSQATNRNENAILADYFGLSPAFQSEVTLKPEIKNILFSLSGYFGFDQWIKGLYLAIHAPAVWTKWDFKMEETIANSGANTTFPARYMDTATVTPIVGSFVTALRGAHTFGQMTEKMAFGKVCGSQSKWGLSDLLIILGYDIVSREHGYAGLNLRVAAPTGNRPKSIVLFEPLIGNGKHWELGLGFSGRVLIWEKDGDQELSFFANANFTHLFKARQTRSFDFCENGFGSRYILLKEFDADENYTGNLIPAINKTTLCCKVSVDIQFELLAMFGYTYKGFVFDAGYNAWIRSKERISLRECIADRTYALKGIQDVVTGVGELSPLTQSTATLHGNAFSEQAVVVDSNSPVFISTNDLDLRSAASPMVLTHKLFANIGYVWQEDENDSYARARRSLAAPCEAQEERRRGEGWVPYIGLGTSVEFEGINTSNTEKPNKNTLSQWAFWLKGGIAFS